MSDMHLLPKQLAMGELLTRSGPDERFRLDLSGPPLFAYSTPVAVFPVAAHQFGFTFSARFLTGR